MPPAPPPSAPPIPATGSRRPSSLTEWLRGRTDAQLAELLQRRPDLALPAPADLAMLASRLSVRTSVQRAVDGLDAFTLRVLEALVLCAEGEVSDVAAAGALLGDGISEADLSRGIAELLELGLVWGEADEPHLVASVTDAVGPHPAGLGRAAQTLLRHVSDLQLAPVLRALGLGPAAQPRAGAAVAEVLASPQRVAELIEQSDDAEREVLDRLAAGPPNGTVRNAQLPTTWPDLAPPHRLIARGLLIPVDSQTVELPREVGIALRGMAVGAVSPTPPVIETLDREPADLDRLGTTAVLDTVRLVESLAEVWAHRPPAALRAGGVGIRELRRTAGDLGVDEPIAALLAETAYAAGLIGAASGPEPVYLPTTEYDTWRRRDPAQRWTDLATAWLAMTRQPSLVSKRDDRDRLISALGPDAERGTVPTLRGRVLDVLTTLRPGAAPASRADVLARLGWSAPRRAGLQRPLAEAILAEADVLGLTAAGGLTGYSRTLLAGSKAAAEHALANALPEPVDYFLVQPDLTIVVPGPPSPALGTELALAADLESSGGASVYRVTEASVRRALDAGRSGADLTALVTERSRTPVPQALSYLIDDVARRHGVLRAGTAAAYLRCDDEGLLSRVLADRDVAALHLRRIAPTIVIATAAVTRVLEVLREAGYAPAAEAPDGEVITLGAATPRAPSAPPMRSIRARSATDSGTHLSEVVRRIRSGEALTTLSRRIAPIAQQVPGVTSASTMGLLRNAIREGQRVLLGVVDPDGTPSRHTILPISLAGGFVRGHESETQRLQSFPLHRLTAVTVVDEPDADDPA
ncbi:MAG: helicase-associated domain-containing protein [Actinomycetota bacterium]|nr:helicase-associated domain-containing protein [Actinomycetota bacterium]